MASKSQQALSLCLLVLYTGAVHGAEPPGKQHVIACDMQGLRAPRLSPEEIKAGSGVRFAVDIAEAVPYKKEYPSCKQGVLLDILQKGWEAMRAVFYVRPVASRKEPVPETSTSSAPAFQPEQKAFTFYHELSDPCHWGVGWSADCNLIQTLYAMFLPPDKVLALYQLVTADYLKGPLAVDELSCWSSSPSVIVSLSAGGTPVGEKNTRKKEDSVPGTIADYLIFRPGNILHFIRTKWNREAWRKGLPKLAGKLWCFEEDVDKGKRHEDHRGIGSDYSLGSFSGNDSSLREKMIRHFSTPGTLPAFISKGNNDEKMRLIAGVRYMSGLETAQYYLLNPEAGAGPDFQKDQLAQWVDEAMLTDKGSLQVLFLSLDPGWSAWSLAGWALVIVIAAGILWQMRIRLSSWYAGLSALVRKPGRHGLPPGQDKGSGSF